MHNALRILGALWWWVVLITPPFALLLWIFDRRPRRSTARAYLGIGWALVALAALVVVASLLEVREQPSLVVDAAWVVVLLAVLAGAFFGAWRVACRELLPLVEGDAVARWAALLGGDEPWWWRARAARELGAIVGAAKAPAARAALLAARPAESNRHVRAAIGRALGRLVGAGDPAPT